MSEGVLHEPQPPQRPVKYVIFDLDGTVIDTETLCIAVSKKVLNRYGKELTPAACKAALGKRPLECWTDVAQILGMDVAPQKLLDESEPLLQEKWSDARLLPGAFRLMSYLEANAIPFAVATSTPRATFNLKLSNKPDMRAMLKHVVCGDEVANGKPNPDVFLKAADLLGAHPSECLVLEDAPSGVEGATNAGMRVALIPSMVGSHQADYPAANPSASQGVVQVLPSLLAFDPTFYGLPAFKDVVGGLIPLDSPFFIKGKVVKGFGRGSKELGIPTANVDDASLACALAEAVTGIYAGWASIGSSPQVHKMVMSIGFNPFYGNSHKTAEPWILANFSQPFYGEEIRLVVCAYIRPEADFPSLEGLVARIHLDADVSRAGLDHPPMSALKSDPWLLPSSAPEAAAAHTPCPAACHGDPSASQ